MPRAIGAYLLDDPMDLTVDPLLLVVRVEYDVFANVAARVVPLAADDAVVGAAAARGVDQAIGRDLLDTVHDEAVADCELALGALAMFVWVMEMGLRFWGEEDLNIFHVGVVVRGSSLVTLSQPLAQIWGATETAGDNKVRLLWLVIFVEVVMTTRGPDHYFMRTRLIEPVQLFVNEHQNFINLFIKELF